MDIRKLISGAGISQEETPQAKKTRHTQDSRPSSGGADRVTLSARRLSPEEAAAQARDQTARAEKVRLLKEAVRSGSYNPDPREVAHNLLFSDFKPLA